MEANFFEGHIARGTNLICTFSDVSPASWAFVFVRLLQMKRKRLTRVCIGGGSRFRSRFDGVNEDVSTNEKFLQF